MTGLGDPVDAALAGRLKQAIKTGDLSALRALLVEHPELVDARLDGCRTPLHVATDWPGHFPNGADAVAILIEAGADVNTRFIGRHTETPLHWAASSDDVEILDALLDGGADIEAEGAVIAGGTPLADAVAFGQWNAARRLVERGARTTIWQEAALGLLDHIEMRFTGQTPAQDEITRAFWCACHGGQQPAAAYLLARGAELNWVGYDGLTSLDAAGRQGAAELAKWLRSQGARPSK